MDDLEFIMILGTDVNLYKNSMCETIEDYMKMTWNESIRVFIIKYQNQYSYIIVEGENPIMEYKNIEELAAALDVWALSRQ